MAAHVETMAFAGEPAWHGLGVKVDADLSPQAMMKAAGLDWRVLEAPVMATINGVQTPTDHKLLYRSSDGRHLDVVPDTWEPVQNDEAFEFFQTFVDAGKASMEVAGSLWDGEKIWGLARMKDVGDVLPGDPQELFLLMANGHSYNTALVTMVTPVRVVCQNTLTMALTKTHERGIEAARISFSHNRAFSPKAAQDAMAAAALQFESYLSRARRLAQFKLTDEQAAEYFAELFPKKERRTLSETIDEKAEEKAQRARSETTRAVETLKELLHTQPGAELGEGTAWAAFNAVTYYTDHIIGRDSERRLDASWFGSRAALKRKAFSIADAFVDA